MQRNSPAHANGFASVVKIAFSLRKFLANGSPRQNSLAIANAMAWCSQSCTTERGQIYWRCIPLIARSKVQHSHFQECSVTPLQHWRTCGNRMWQSDTTVRDKLCSWWATKFVVDFAADFSVDFFCTFFQIKKYYLPKISRIIIFAESSNFTPHSSKRPSFLRILGSQASPQIVRKNKDWGVNFVITFSRGRGPRDLRVRPPGIEWKTGRNPKMGKNWPKNGKWPSARNGEKMAQKWRKNGIWGHFSIFSLFLGHFFPISGRGPFSIFLANFFPFWISSILYQAAWLASLETLHKNGLLVVHICWCTLSGLLSTAQAPHSVLWPSPSSGERSRYVPLSLL